MTTSRHNPHLAKRYFSYTVEEVARLYGVTRNTVRAWIKAGLPTTDGLRPQLVHGADLADFLRGRRSARQQRCAPGELYCMRCRAPRKAAAGRASYRPLTQTQGNLIARCEACAALMNRRVSLRKLAAAAGDLAVTMAQGGEHIDESPAPTVNHDIALEG